VSVTPRKPGVVRWFTIRLVFWLITEFVTRVYRRGFLSDIGTIHFARWITVPGTRDFIFLSNYGGSWESYLEDFITRAHFGLTGVWSNSIGFPRTNNLIDGGASDGERFKRYARRGMLPTPFWYTAYRDTTTSHIRTNASIRRGLASALTNEEALDWLALFGSAARPDAKMESSEIQSLVFGGLGFLTFGVCLLYRLSGNQQQAQAFIKQLTPHVAFNDGRRLQSDAVISIGLGPEALAKLGLPPDCVTGFPAAYLGGMAARARIVGDIDENAPGKWSWGADELLDVTILIYGTSAQAVRDLDAKIQKSAASHGATERYRIDLVKVEEAGTKTEPFGFVDGISQPLIRGTYKSLRKPDSIHIVEPGEFLPDRFGRAEYRNIQRLMIGQDFKLMPFRHGQNSIEVFRLNGEKLELERAELAGPQAHVAVATHHETIADIQFAGISAVPPVARPFRHARDHPAAIVRRPFAGRAQGQFLKDEMSLNCHRARKLADH